MFSKTDIQYLEGKFAQFATKEDLNRFATKEDLKQFATKKDLNQFATKKDIKKLREAIEGDIDSLEYTINAKIDDLDTKIEDYYEKFKNEVIQFKDDILFKFRQLQEENIVTTGYRDKIENHENRIEKLEQSNLIPSISASV